MTLTVDDLISELQILSLQGHGNKEMRACYRLTENYPFPLKEVEVIEEPKEYRTCISVNSSFVLLSEK